MIGVCCSPWEAQSASEFFELFKTPWEFYNPSHDYEVILSTDRIVDGGSVRLGLVFNSQAACHRAHAVPTAPGEGKSDLTWKEARIPLYGESCTFLPSFPPMALQRSDGAGAVVTVTEDGPRRICHFGFDLFDEIKRLLTVGQPKENSFHPTLDLYVDLIRQTILSAGIALVEVPPAPAGHPYMVCLTHDVDFASIRSHWNDHTMWGFLYRALLREPVQYLRGNVSGQALATNYRAALSLPLVYAGLKHDFWFTFDAYDRIEGARPSTYFLIPFKDRSGDHVSLPHVGWRAAKYDVSRLFERVAELQRCGREVGLHAIDAWHSPEAARREKNRITSVTGARTVGSRTHWLCGDAGTAAILDTAGFLYDASMGYNETVGYRSGTAQPFRPFSARHLLSLPLHIQDVALLDSRGLNLSQPDACRLCDRLRQDRCQHGGVLSVLWHMRSIAPERLWAHAYRRLIASYDADNAYFATAREAITWFRTRREVRFEAEQRTATDITLKVSNATAPSTVPLVLRVYHGLTPNLDPTVAATYYITDRVLNGETHHTLALAKGDATREHAKSTDLHSTAL